MPGHNFTSMKAFMPICTGIDVGPARKPLPSFEKEKDRIEKIFESIKV